MYRTHTCGELRLEHAGNTVTLAGWVHRIRDFGGMNFIDLRDRYGITQLVFNPEHNDALAQSASQLGREFVIAVKGKVVERSNKNLQIPTGEIEIIVDELNVLNASITPPFTIEDDTDGGDDLRMKYRYLDLRRNPLQQNLLKRHEVAKAVRAYMDAQGFADVETPFFIKSTPEGARDFVVPSRLNPGQFYALPQSPQTFKQLLMVSGFDRYYQIVRCFRDEDLRADRQPEFTQIDCEMAFVEREDVLQMFEGLVKNVFKKVKGIELPEFPRMSYDDAMLFYGNDKPDIRFAMKFVALRESTPLSLGEGQGVRKNSVMIFPTGFKVFDDAETVIGICATGCAEYSRKQLDELTEFVKRPQLGANGLVYIKCNADGTFKSSVDKFYSQEDLKNIAEKFSAKAGDLILILAGETARTRKALSELRLEMGNRLGLRSKEEFKPLWVLDFPLLEFDEEEKRWNAMHHPFTSWRKEDDALLETDPGKVKANAYDIVMNGVELGGGSIRIHNRKNQERMFSALGMSKEQYDYKFGFILNAFEYGTPPHGGIAFGFDRFCSMVTANQEGIRDFIAFPKNNMGRDMMLDAPSDIDEKQKKELGL
ncbi:MAG: aspartate--tRNA ligase [Chitinophagales bacterium]|nr:aspartate--tRNA ligase [Chitinophagales bacterium]